MRALHSRIGRFATVALALRVIAHAQGSPTGTLPAVPVVSSVKAPAVAGHYAVDWASIRAPAVGTMLAAVARPAGNATFPAVILLHGTHGFAPEYVQLAVDLAQQGVIAVAPCWFAGGSGAGSAFVSAPIPCPEAPPMPSPITVEAFRTIQALVAATRGVAGVRPDRVTIFGHSRGGGAALHYSQHADNVAGIILDSAGYPEGPDAVAAGVRIPVLLLHGTADGPATGGSEFTAPSRARAFESALRRHGRAVAAHYYEGAGHNGIFTDRVQHADAAARIATFAKQEPISGH